METGGAQLKIVEKKRVSLCNIFKGFYLYSTITICNLRNTFGVKDDISFILYMDI